MCVILLIDIIHKLRLRLKKRSARENLERENPLNLQKHKETFTNNLRRGRYTLTSAVTERFFPKAKCLVPFCQPQAILLDVSSLLPFFPFHSCTHTPSLKKDSSILKTRAEFLDAQTDQVPLTQTVAQTWVGYSNCLWYCFWKSLTLFPQPNITTCSNPAPLAFTKPF